MKTVMIEITRSAEHLLIKDATSSRIQDPGHSLIHTKRPVTIRPGEIQTDTGTPQIDHTTLCRANHALRNLIPSHNPIPDPSRNKHLPNLILSPFLPGNPRDWVSNPALLGSHFLIKPSQSLTTIDAAVRQDHRVVFNDTLSMVCIGNVTC